MKDLWLDRKFNSGKKIRVMFEFPEKWIDLNSPIGFAGDVLRNELHKGLEEYVIKKLIEKTKLPDIKISKEEVKDRMLDILAEEALEDKEGLFKQ